MNSTAKKIMLIILASFVLEAFVGFIAFRVYSNMSAAETESAPTVDSIPINDDTLIILFTHAGNDVDGNPIEKQIYIQGSVSIDDIPYYPDKEQLVIVSCKDPELLLHGKTALVKQGYMNLMEM